MNFACFTSTLVRILVQYLLRPNGYMQGLLGCEIQVLSLLALLVQQYKY